MKIAEIMDFTETFAPINTAFDFDNVGLLVGNKEEQVKGVLLSLDATRDVLDEALIKGCNLIITHHPVIFNPLKKIDKEDLICDIIKNDISVLSLHTNLDISEIFGVNTVLAEKIGLNNVSKVNSHEEIIFTGELKEECTPEEFAKNVKTNLSAPIIKYTKGRKIKNVAVSSGAGGEGIFSVPFIDAYVTGEIKHHQIVFAKEKNITLIEAGHFYTENIVISPLAEKLSKKFPHIKFYVSENQSDGIALE